LDPRSSAPIRSGGRTNRYATRTPRFERNGSDFIKPDSLRSTRSDPTATVYARERVFGVLILTVHPRINGHQPLFLLPTTRTAAPPPLPRRRSRRRRGIATLVASNTNPKRAKRGTCPGEHRKGLLTTNRASRSVVHGGGRPDGGVTCSASYSKLTRTRLTQMKPQSRSAGPDKTPRPPIEVTAGVRPWIQAGGLFLYIFPAPSPFQTSPPCSLSLGFVRAWLRLVLGGKKKRNLGTSSQHGRLWGEQRMRGRNWCA
jgi:hypothetical protein